jgi:protein-S-isoprenylcysteine O-methyltransferase Ste14
VPRATIQVLAAFMAAANLAAWILASRWERPGRDAELRVALRPPPLIRWGSDLIQVVPLLYPGLVVFAPRWGYEGSLNWSSGIDVALQMVGFGVWVLGIVVVIWAARVIQKYMAVSGVTMDHRLETGGPYRYVRHPVYASMAAIAIGTALVFRSYLLLGIATASVAAGHWWAAAEERLLGSPQGFGDTYLTYASQTGRFLPRVRRARSVDR